MSLFEHEMEKVNLLKQIRDCLLVLTEKHDVPPRKFFTKAEVCQRLGIGTTTIDKMVKNGDWRVYYITDDIPRFNIDEFEGELRTVRRAPKVNRRNGGFRRTGQIEKFMADIKKEG